MALVPRFVFAVGVAFFAQSALAAGDLTGTRPNAGGEPEQVAVGVGLLDIAEIDDREQVFIADLDLRDFPFATQRLSIDIVSYEYSPADIVFSDASELVARLDDLGGEGWTYEATEPERSVYRDRNCLLAHRVPPRVWPDHPVDDYHVSNQQV